MPLLIALKKVYNIKNKQRNNYTSILQTITTSIQIDILICKQTRQCIYEQYMFSLNTDTDRGM